MSSHNFSPLLSFIAHTDFSHGIDTTMHNPKVKNMLKNYAVDKTTLNSREWNKCCRGEAPLELIELCQSIPIIELATQVVYLQEKLDSNILDFNTKINTLENKMIKENESLKQHLSNQYQIKLDSNILDFNTKMNTLENRMIKENEYLKQQLRYQLYLFICLCILYLFHIQN